MDHNHYVGVEHAHNCFDNERPAVVTVTSGDVVVFDCPGPPLPPEATVEDFSAIDFERPHTIVGPVAVEGASPGDTLVVEVLEVGLPQPFGHCLFLPGLGLLGDHFSEPYVQSFRFEDGQAELKAGVTIPLQPFCGIMGVAPAEPGEHSTIPPRPAGGNLDIRHLTAPSMLELPVLVDGALFSCGDGHAAQGDGEVCLTGLETAVRPALRLSLLKDRSIPEPRFTKRGALGRPGDGGEHFATVATGSELLECCQRAVRYMIEHLVNERGLTREEAYVLCSLVVDLKLSEVVNFPSWVVSAYLPLSVFS